MNKFWFRCRLFVLLAFVPLYAMGEPPFGGTAFVDPNIIVSTDPSVFGQVVDKGQGMRTVFDRRTNAFGAINAFLFEAMGTDGSLIEAQINPEFGSVDAARVEAQRYTRLIGQMPWASRRNVKTFAVHQGDQDFGGNRNGSLLIHAGRTATYVDFGALEEILIHEAGHASLDERHENAPAWLAAQAADGEFISTYARDNPTREDVAESYLMYLAVRDTSGRVSESLKTQVLSVIPHRIAYFDVERVLDWAERTYPQIFGPAGQSTLSLTGYRYRSYANGHFLAIQEASPARLLYLGPLSNNTALDLGLLSNWVAQAAP